MIETLTAAVVGVVFVIAVWVGRVWNRARNLPDGRHHAEDKDE